MLTVEIRMAVVCVLFITVLTNLIAPCLAGVWAQKNDLTGEICQDEAQSPIDFKHHFALNDEPCDFKPCDGMTVDQMLDGEFERILFNDGHKVQVRFEGNRKICIVGGGLPEKYYLEQYHFHWGEDENEGSEHAVCGKHYPMEAHFVFYSNHKGSFHAAEDEPMGLTVFGFFFNLTNEANEYMREITRKLNKIKTPDRSGVVFHHINDHSLLRLIYPLIVGNKETYWRYYGSLTHAPYYESVIWTVYKEPLGISEGQLKEFRTIEDEHGNPIKEAFHDEIFPLNDRLVYTNKPDGHSHC